MGRQESVSASALQTEKLYIKHMLPCLEAKIGNLKYKRSSDREDGIMFYSMRTPKDSFLQWQIRHHGMCYVSFTIGGVEYNINLAYHNRMRAALKELTDRVEKDFWAGGKI